MQAVILAAGKGTRMGIKDTPKCLLKIGNKTIIEHQIDYLRNIGCKKILVVTGYNSNKIKNTLGNSAEYVLNKNFETSNNMYSLWEAQNFIVDEFVCVYGDLFFHKKILEKCVLSEGDIVLAVERNLRAETMKVKIENNKVIQVNKEIDRYYSLAIENLIKQEKIVNFIETDGLPWSDIDTKEEFDEVKKINKEFGDW